MNRAPLVIAGFVSWIAPWRTPYIAKRSIVYSLIEADVNNFLAKNINYTEEVI
jgi:hypothetical protein